MFDTSKAGSAMPYSSADGAVYELCTTHLGMKNYKCNFDYYLKNKFILHRHDSNFIHMINTSLELIEAN